MLIIKITHYNVELYHPKIVKSQAEIANTITIKL